jgi:hypothetical protein
MSRSAPVITLNRETGTYDFDPAAVSFVKEPLCNKIDNSEVYHVSPQYQGKSFLKVRTPVCFCSGLYSRVNKDNGRTSTSGSIWLYANWNKDVKKKSKNEEAHRKVWEDLFECNRLLDTPEYKSTKSKIGIPTKEKVIDKLPHFIRNAVFRDGDQKGEIDINRPVRIKAAVWTAKPKGNPKKVSEEKKGDAKKQLPTEDNGDRMLCTFQRLDKTPIDISELMERPFKAVFVILWSADFFGANNYTQLKMCNVIVTELMDKMSMNGVDDSTMDDIRDEVVQQRGEEDDNATNPTKLEEASDDDDSDNKEEKKDKGKEKTKEKETKEKGKGKDKEKKKDSDDEEEKDEEELKEKEKKAKGKEKKEKKKVSSLINDE